MEVAQLAGISDRTYRDWEYGRYTPRPGPSLRAVAAAFRVSPGFLLFGEENEDAKR